MTVPMLTPKQKKVLEFIEGFRDRNGYSPSQHEIAKHFGFASLGTVQNYLVRLERQGALTKVWNARRGALVVSAEQEAARGGLRQVVAPQSRPVPSIGLIPLPLLGRVAAGRPIEAVADPGAETVDVPSTMIKAARGAEHFVLRVKGDSMIDDGILDGDAVVIKRQADAENGQTVVALINNEATIKRIHKKGGVIELHAANPKYKPIVVSGDDVADFKIEGVLAGVIRICR